MTASVCSVSASTFTRTFLDVLLCYSHALSSPPTPQNYGALSLDRSENGIFSSSALIVSAPPLTSQDFYFFPHPNKYLLQTLEQIMKPIPFDEPHKPFGFSLRLWPRFRTVPMLSNMFSHPNGELYSTASYTARRERERSGGSLWEIGERPLSYLWGLSMVDMEDYTGTKIALPACVVYALLVLHYYRRVLLSWRTIEGFISTLCTECLYGPFLPSSRCRKILSIRFLKEPCQKEEV